MNMILCWRLVNGLEASSKDVSRSSRSTIFMCRKSCPLLLSFFALFFYSCKTKVCRESSSFLSYLGRPLRMSVLQWSVPPPSLWGLTCGGPCFQQGQVGKRHYEVGKNRVQLLFLLDSLLLRRDTCEGEGFIAPPPTDTHPPPRFHTTLLNIHQAPANHLQGTLTETLHMTLV